MNYIYLSDPSSATSNSILDKAIDSEDAQHKDFLRLVSKQISCTYENKKKIFCTYMRNTCNRNSVSVYLVGTCWRVSWVVCKNKNFLHNSSGKMGCWFLCQGGWWRPCQFRYMLFSIMYTFAIFMIVVNNFSILSEVGFFYASFLFRYVSYNTCPSPTKA